MPGNQTQPEDVPPRARKRCTEGEREKETEIRQLAQLGNLVDCCHHIAHNCCLSVYLAVLKNKRNTRIVIATTTKTTKTTNETEQFSLSSFPHCQKYFQSKNVRNFRNVEKKRNQTKANSQNI